MPKTIKCYVDSIVSQAPAEVTSRFNVREPIDLELVKKRLHESQLPVEIAELLFQDFDGQATDSIGLLGEFRLCRFEQAMDIWNENCEIMQEEFFPSDKRIKGGVCWRRLWFPFGWNQNDNSFLFLDFDPTDQGTRGQVLFHPGRDVPDYFVANSLSEFLAHQYSKIENTGFELSDYNELARVHEFPD